MKYLIRNTVLGLFAAAFLAAPAVAQDITVGDLTIENPHIRATPPNAPVSGGYLIIRNNGTDADRLTAGEADFAGKTEVHEMAMDGDVMKMRKLADGLEIPAGGMVELKPGGYHLMFMKLNEQMKAGDTRQVKLMFENTGAIDIDFEVRKPGQMKKSGDGGNG